MTRQEQLESFLTEASAELDNIITQIAPLQEQYDTLSSQINDIDVQRRVVAEQLKVLRTSFNELNKEVRGYKVALGIDKPAQTTAVGTSGVELDPQPETNLDAPTGDVTFE